MNTIEKLAPCPFCGSTGAQFERIGTPRQSCIVACNNCGARHESSDEGLACGSSWNDRAQQAGGVPAGLVSRPMHELSFPEQEGAVRAFDASHIALFQYGDVLHRVWVEGYDYACRATLTAAPTPPVQPNAQLLLGWQRYEKARRLNPRQWKDLHARNLAGEFFDDMIDALPPVSTPVPSAVQPLSEAQPAFTAADVYILIGHAATLIHEGQTDMPKYFHELAVRIAEQVGDPWLINKAKAIAVTPKETTPPAAGQKENEG